MVDRDALPTRADRVITPDAAAALVPDGATLAVGGSGSLLQVPESLLEAIGKRFELQRRPQRLTVVHVMGLGDHTGRGVDHLAKQGLTRRFIGSHFVLSPVEQALIAQDLVEAVVLPAGTISLLYREIAAGRPGLFTDIGLDTFIDPRQSGGRMNPSTRAGLSRVITIDEREWLFYPAFPIDVALLRATESDGDGNLTMDDEAGLSDNLALAQAARNSGGIVVAEVKRVVPKGAIPAARVRVPATFVDHVVVTQHPHQTPITAFEPARTGTLPPVHDQVSPLPLTSRKVVARRALQEIAVGDVVNLGVGMANGISYVAAEEGVLENMTLTIEQGIYGGIPGIGLDSGTALHPSALIDMPSQFDFYDGGGLDSAALGFAEVDRWGNVNVVKVGSVPIGPGGFIDISQKAGTAIFCGSLTGGGLVTHIESGRLVIDREGSYGKFVADVEAIAFSGARADRCHQRVIYITERAVFRLHAGRLTLTEIAPGIDLARDVLDLLPFEPHMPRPPTLMGDNFFRPGRMGVSLRRRTAVPPPRRSTARQPQ